MKALSIIQPWATLVVIGAKHFETRSWKTSYRGPLAIHASKTKPKLFADIVNSGYFLKALYSAGITDPATQLPFGALIGRVELLDCIRAEDLADKDGPDIIEKDFGDFRPGRWAWRLTHATQLVSPIPFPGRVGLFEVPDGIAGSDEQSLAAS